MTQTLNSFLQLYVKVRTARNKIIVLHNSKGNVLTYPKEIQEEIAEFYKKLLGSSSGELEAVDLSIVRASPKLSQEPCIVLTQKVTIDEIDQALTSIDDVKALRFYGFNSLCFKKSWHLIKNDIYVVVMDFFKMLTSINMSIALQLP